MGMGPNQYFNNDLKDRGVITDDEIWRKNPEKVFGVTQEWADENPNTHLALVKALIRAAVALNTRGEQTARPVRPALITSKSRRGDRPPRHLVTSTPPHLHTHTPPTPPAPRGTSSACTPTSRAGPEGALSSAHGLHRPTPLHPEPLSAAPPDLRSGDAASSKPTEEHP